MKSRTVIPLRRVSRAVALVTAGALIVGLSACSSDSGTVTGSPSKPKASESAEGWEMPQVDEALRALLPEDLADAVSITAGSSLATPPQNFTHPETGEAAGYYAEMLVAASAKLGLEVVWEKTPYPGLIPAMQSGKIDVMSPGTPSPDALKVVDVATTVTRTSGMLVARGRGDEIKKTTDACGLKIAYTAGSLADEANANQIVDDCAAAGKSAPELTTFPAAAAAQTAVRSGQVDGFIEPDAITVWEANTGEHFDSTLLDAFPKSTSGFSFLKANGAELAEAYVAAIQSLQEDGTYDKILDKYDVLDVSALPGPSELIQ